MDLESMATCMTLFSMFISGVESRGKASQVTSQTQSIGTPSGQKRGSPQTSGKKDDSWAVMMDSEFQYSKVGTWNEMAWGWAIEKARYPAVSLRSPAKSTRAAVSATTKKNSFLVDALDLARKFASEDNWAKHAAVRMGWIAQSRDDALRRNIINSIILESLHLLREEFKLNILMKVSCSREDKLLVAIIAQIGHWLNWQSWDWRTGNYYELEGLKATEWKFDDSK